MGLLTVGVPLSWKDSQPYIEYIKKHGIEQFINLYNKYSNKCCDTFKWGDELEYILAIVPPNERTVLLSLRSKEIRTQCKSNIADDVKADTFDKAIIHPEYGCFMIEATPLEPYNDTACDLLLVERNMFARRLLIEKCLNADERLLTFSSFPLMGVGNYLSPYSSANGPIACSQFISDSVISHHPRYGTLTRNIRERRGKPVSIHIPIFRDLHTPLTENCIYMDAMAFGMGNCCTQVTFQCRDINEARHLYDQLAVLTPIMMALTAATPFAKGKISDLDARWTTIAQSVDDRTDGERGIATLGANERRIYKSRYDTISNFISTKMIDIADYNDIEIEKNESAYKRLRSAGIDKLLSQHISHLFIRDPLVIYKDLIRMDDMENSHHFETIQSTNWQNVRFKPPPVMNENVNNIGWRVEFRSMEIQMTEFENAAIVVFVTLASRAILYFNLNLYIPISKVDENFHNGHRRDAVLQEKFWWRTCHKMSVENNNAIMAKLSIADILVGNVCEGLIGIVKRYLNEIGCEGKALEVMYEYLDLIECRAKGECMTCAHWMRNFVMHHPLYKRDSCLNQEIVRDLVDVTQDIIHGRRKAPFLLGNNIDLSARYYKESDCGCDETTAPKLLSKL